MGFFSVGDSGQDRMRRAIKAEAKAKGVKISNAEVERQVVRHITKVLGGK